LGNNVFDNRLNTTKTVPNEITSLGCGPQKGHSRIQIVFCAFIYSELR